MRADEWSEHNGSSLRIARITGDSREGGHMEHNRSFFYFLFSFPEATNDCYRLCQIPSASLCLSEFLHLITLYLAYRIILVCNNVGLVFVVLANIAFGNKNTLLTK